MSPEILAVIPVVAALSGVALGWMGRAREVKKETEEETASAVTLQTDMEYIKRGVDEIRIEQRLMGSNLNAISERVTRVEESAKSAHHRINQIEAKRP